MIAWLRLTLVKSGIFWLHATTDPGCRHYRRPRPGSRLELASRGWGCELCTGSPYRHRNVGAFINGLSVEQQRQEMADDVARLIGEEADRG